MPTSVARGPSTGIRSTTIGPSVGPNWHKSAGSSTRQRELYDAQDAIDQRREALIAKIEGQLRMSENLLPFFTMRWELR